MRSSGGQYFAGLDHVRGLAAFLVVSWHFIHWSNGIPVPFNRDWWLGPFDEGHVGVSVFMTLSGYLFAKLIGDRRIDYGGFLWNRIIRLFPLLMLTMAVYGWLHGFSALAVVLGVIEGMVFPILPNGGWSITAELHFYLVLPPLLAALRRDWRWAGGLLALSIGGRIALWAAGVDVQHLAYMTIVGRIDQFVCGIAAWRARDLISGKVAVTGLVGLWGFYAWFGWNGGYYGDLPDGWWTVVPAIEGLTIAALIAWYDRHPLKDVWVLRKAGQYSYSIYLLHFFFVREAALFVHQRIVPIDSYWLALPWAVLFFGGMMVVGGFAWKLVEEPPLRWRRPYIRKDPETTA